MNGVHLVCMCQQVIRKFIYHEIEYTYAYINICICSTREDRLKGQCHETNKLQQSTEDPWTNTIIWPHFELQPVSNEKRISRLFIFSIDC